jgi:hypothetical protein
MKFLALAAAASALRLTACDCTATPLAKGCEAECPAKAGLNAETCCVNGVKSATVAGCANWNGSCGFPADRATCCADGAAKTGAPAACKGFVCTA